MGCAGPVQHEWQPFCVNARPATLDAVATAAIEAANAQYTIVPGQQLAAGVVARLAEEVMALDTEIGDTDDFSSSGALILDYRITLYLYQYRGEWCDAPHRVPIL